MPEAVSDTGPILHLHEIGRLPLLGTLSPLQIPELVGTELDFYRIGPAELERAGIELTVVPIAEPEWKKILLTPGFSRIQAADAQVFAVARSHSFRVLVLTDDLALRRLLEGEGATVAGTLGLLIRTYRAGRLTRGALEGCVDDLLERSRQLNPKIGYATVYRTLKLLVEAGLAHQRDFGEGQSRFEVDSDHHDHLICTKCGLVLEFEDEEGGEGAEDDTTPGTYVLGLKSTNRKQIRKVLNKVDRDPLVIAPVIDTCLGD